MRFDQSALGGRFRPILDIFRLVCSCFLAPFVGPLDELSFSDTLKLRHPDISGRVRLVRSVCLMSVWFDRVWVSGGGIRCLILMRSNLTWTPRVLAVVSMFVWMSGLGVQRSD